MSCIQDDLLCREYQAQQQQWTVLETFSIRISWCIQYFPSSLAPGSCTQDWGVVIEDSNIFISIDFHFDQIEQIQTQVGFVRNLKVECLQINPWLRKNHGFICVTMHGIGCAVCMFGLLSILEIWLSTINWLRNTMTYELASDMYRCKLINTLVDTSFFGQDDVFGNTQGFFHCMFLTVFNQAHFSNTTIQTPICGSCRA